MCHQRQPLAPPPVSIPSKRADAQCVNCATAPARIAPEASLNCPFLQGDRLPSSPNLSSDDHANVEPHHHSETRQDAAVTPTSVDIDESGRHTVTAQSPSERWLTEAVHIWFLMLPSLPGPISLWMTIVLILGSHHFLQIGL